MTTGQGNPFFDLGLFEGDPIGDRLIFNSAQPENLSPFQANSFQSLFEPTFNSFLGALGSQIRRGDAPTLSFQNFLQNDFNPNRALLRQNSGGSGSGGPTLFRFNR